MYACCDIWELFSASFLNPPNHSSQSVSTFSFSFITSTIWFPENLGDFRLWIWGGTESGNFSKAYFSALIGVFSELFFYSCCSTELWSSLRPSDLTGELFDPGLRSSISMTNLFFIVQCWFNFYSLISLIFLQTFILFLRRLNTNI